MKLAIHAFYVAIVIRNSQLCYNGIQVSIISIRPQEVNFLFLIP